MRIKSSIVKWNFKIDFRNFDADVAREIDNEHVVDAIFTNFDIISNVNNAKRERFDEIQNICFDVATKITNEINEFLVCFEIVTNLNIENFDVVVDKMISEIDCEIVDEICEILFFFLLQFRFETNLFIFFVAWCWRKCSWNLFFESKIFSQCLQTIFLQTIFWICCNNRINDEKHAKQLRHEWYCDEKRTDETKKISNFENFVKNAMIKTSSHSLKFCLTISFCFWYQNNAKSRRQSSNKINKSDFRYWCWYCRNCYKKLAISLNRLNFWISQTSVASKKSIFATTKIDFVISSCKTNEHSNDFWKCFFNDSKFRLLVIFNEQCIHFVLYSSSMHLNSTTIMNSLVESLFFQIQYWKLANFSSYVLKDLTNETKAKKDSIFDWDFVKRFMTIECFMTSELKIVLNENFRYKFMTCILDRKQKKRVDLICKRVCFDQIFQIVMKMFVQILKKMSCWRTNR